jgi:hypothetical protein
VLRVEPPAPPAPLLKDQFDFLVEHARRARLDRGNCGSRFGELCPSCVRFMRLKDVLMKPFTVAPAEWAKKKGLAA